MVELKVKENYVVDRYSIEIDGDDADVDSHIANKLGMPYDEYIKNLKDCGAFEYYTEYYFKTKESAQKCVNRLNSWQQWKEYYESEDAKPEPPLGIMPKDMFERQRVQDLSRALFEYIDDDNTNYELMVGWAGELYDRLMDLKFASED